MYVCLCVSLSVLPACLPVCLPVSLSVCLSVLPACLSLCLSVCPACLPVSLSVCLSCLPACLSVCLSVCLSCSILPSICPSFRCVIAELFLDGRPLFTLSQLLEYCNNERESYEITLKKIEDKMIRVTWLFRTFHAYSMMLACLSENGISHDTA